ncbi:MAG: ROK family protein [Phycisphaerales bacterium]|nr:ROK family protein [Phycisphaerales bacterium]
MIDLSGCVLIGVDGGATEVKAHEVGVDRPTNPQRFELRSAHASRVYRTHDDFAPKPVAEQLAERDNPVLSDGEISQGAEWIESAAAAIAETAVSAGKHRLVVGMGMPGLKTADGRGIAVINNGPRMPKFFAQLEALLVGRGLELAAPLARLGSDADYCGLGEQWAADGTFRDVENAYYVGGGTGVADAMKLHGALVTFDAAREWMQKSWQMSSTQGPTFEQIVSAKSMNRGYRESIGQPDSHSFPESDALTGSPEAITWLAKVADALAELIVERIDTVKNGRRAIPERGEAYAKLSADHPYRGTLLDRVVIGQRVGHIYADAKYRAVFGAKVDACIVERITALDDDALAAHCVAFGALKRGFVRGSSLRAAPALGAAVAAVQALAS